MINWNTVPATYNDSLTYMEMLGKCITVCQQLFDRVSEIEIDSEQININKQDISYLKDSVYALAERVDGLEIVTGNTKTPQTAFFESGEITLDETNTVNIPIPENMQDADVFIVSFGLEFGEAPYTHSEYITVRFNREQAYIDHYIKYSGAPVVVGIIPLGMSGGGDTIEIMITTTARPVALDNSDLASITAFWLPATE